MLKASYYLFIALFLDAVSKIVLWLFLYMGYADPIWFYYYITIPLKLIMIFTFLSFLRATISLESKIEEVIQHGKTSKNGQSRQNN
jgi:low affinity Fe/Cu permease